MSLIRPEQAHAINGVPGRLFALNVPPAPWVAGVFASQKWISQRRGVRDYGPGAMMTVNVRFDDNCKNGRMSFAITAITADIVTPASQRRNDVEACGCLHEDIARVFPELAPLIKWHLFDTDGPMHYIANTLYHALQHGANRAWVYYTGPGNVDPLGIAASTTKERLLGYVDGEQARKAEGVEGYRVEWDEKTVKVQNLEHARSSACWPEATDAQLNLPPEKLRALLEARLPALLDAFRADMLAAGFLWEAPSRV